MVYIVYISGSHESSFYLSVISCIISHASWFWYSIFMSFSLRIAQVPHQSGVFDGSGKMSLSSSSSSSSLRNRSFIKSRIHRESGILQTGRPWSFRCEACTASFEDESKLRQHECQNDLRHCRYCGRGFNTTGNLRRHERVHTGEKPFQCRFCNKSFTRKEGVRLHENLHTGRNPFACIYCGMSFPRNKSRKNHEKTCTFIPNPIIDQWGPFLLFSPTGDTWDENLYILYIFK